MPKLPLVGTKVEVYSSTELKLVAEATELDNKKEVTEGLGTARFTIKRTLPSELPELGDNVKIWIKRAGTAAVQKFDGYIEELSKNEEGREVRIECECDELPVFARRITTIKSSGTWQHDTLIKEIVKPLTDDGIITVNNVAVMLSQVRFKKIEGEPIFDTLRKLCTQYPPVDFKLDNDKDLHADYKENAPASTVSLDQTDPNNPRIFNCEFTEGARKVRNAIGPPQLLGEAVIIEKNGNKDYWTESTTYWSGAYKVNGTWYPLTPETSTLFKTYGGSSITVTASYATKAIEAVRLTLVDPTLQIERLQWGGYLYLDVAAKRERTTSILGKRWIEKEFGETGRIELLLEVDCYDDNDYLAGYKTTIEAGRFFRNIEKIPIGPVDRFATWDWYRWNKLNRIEIIVYTQWTGDGGTQIGRLVDRAQLWVDKLYFYDLHAFASYAVQSSIDKFGLRPYEKRVERAGLKTDSDCLEKAKSIIDPLATEEKALRSLTCEGNQFLEPGTMIYVKTDLVNNSYYIRKVEDHVTEDFEYTNELELSSSLVSPPVKTRELLEIEKESRLRRLEKRVDILDSRIKPYKDPYVYPGQVLGSSDLVNFQETNWNWDTILPGVGGLAIGAIKQALGAGQAIWDNIISALGLARGDELIEAETIFAEQITASSINTDHLRSNIIYAKHITASTITTDHLRANIINASKIMASSIQTNHLQSNLIYAQHITSSAITTDHLQSNIIYAKHITASSVDANHIRSNVIQAQHLIANQVVVSYSAQIANAIIDNLKIVNGTISWQKTKNTFGKNIFYQHGTFLLSAEGILGYDVYTDGASVSFRKNQIAVGLIAYDGAVGRIRGYRHLELHHDPWFKTKFKIDSNSVSQVKAIVAIGDGANLNAVGFLLNGEDLYGYWYDVEGAQGSKFLTTISTDEYHVLSQKTVSVPFSPSSYVRVYWNVDGVSYPWVQYFAPFNLYNELYFSFRNYSDSYTKQLEILSFSVKEDWQ